MRLIGLLVALGSLSYCQNTCTIDGTVIDAASGVSIARAQVEAIGPVTRGAATDSDGKWVISGIACNLPALVGVSKPHYAPANLRTRDQHSIQIKLTRESWAAGTVTDPDGDALGASIRIYSQRLTERGLKDVSAAMARTDESGNWRAQLLPGEYTACALSLGKLYPVGGGEELRFPERCLPVSIQSGQDARLDFTLTAVPSVQVTGRITGIPLGTVPVVEIVRPGHEGEINIPAQFASSGQFHFAGLIPDLYTIKASAMAGEKSWYALEDLTVGGGGIEGLTLALRPAVTIAGTVRLESSHPDWPKPAVSVSLQPDGGTAEWNDAGDAFTISNVAPKKYRLRAEAERYYIKSIRAGNEDVRNQEIDLSAPPGPIEIVFANDWGWVEGTVTDSHDDPAESLIWIRQNEDVPRMVQTDSSGRFRNLNLPPGHYEAMAVEIPPVPVRSLPSEWKGVEFDVSPLVGSTVSLVRSNRP